MNYIRLFKPTFIQADFKRLPVCSRGSRSFYNRSNPKTGFELSQYKTAGKTEQTKKIHDILFKSGSKPKGGKTFEESEEKPVFKNPLDRYIEVH